MQEKPLSFIQYEVIYSRQKDSNKWTRKAERKEAAIKDFGIQKAIVLHENEKEEDSKRVRYEVTVKCDPLFKKPIGVSP